jgi:hypothetical protein
MRSQTSEDIDGSVPRHVDQVAVPQDVMKTRTCSVVSADMLQLGEVKVMGMTVRPIV